VLLQKPWEPITVEEMRAWIGMNIFRGVQRLHRTSMYWSGITRSIWMMNVMTCTRFRNINAVWHISDPIGEDKVKAEGKSVHWLHKLQPLIDSVRKACHSLWKCGQYITVDELRVKFKGRHPALIFAPRKPIRNGFTAHMAVCSLSTFIHDFLIYQGQVDKERRYGLAKDIVLKLVWDRLQKGHIVVGDNWFSSRPLARALRAGGTGYVGTLRRNVTGFPEQWCRVRKKKDKEEKAKPPKKKMTQGKWEFYQADGVNMGAWGDSVTVLLVDTVLDPRTTTTVKRWDEAKEERVEKPAPAVAKLYGTHMGAVDHANRMMHAYWPGTGSVRWWVVLAWGVISIAIHNAYIHHSHLHSKKLTNVKFRLQLAKELVGTFSGRKRAVRAGTNRSGIHTLANSRKERECALCHMDGARKQTWFWCAECRIPLCRKLCFDLHCT
jgi:hypothetical protein